MFILFEQTTRSSSSSSLELNMMQDRGQQRKRRRGNEVEQQQPGSKFVWGEGDKTKKSKIIVVDTNGQQQQHQLNQEETDVAAFATTTSAATATLRRRRRTEQYLKELERHENVQRTCQFFLQGLANVRRTQHAQDDRSYNCTSLLEENLHREAESHRQQFLQSTKIHSQMARKSIQLKQSMVCVESAVVDVFADHPSSSSLKKLNQGQETSKALLDKISAFVGVPSDDDIVDCQDMLTLIGQSFSQSL